MPTPAIRKVQDQVKSRLEARRPDLFVFIDRTEEEPLAAEELPGVVLNMLDLNFTPFEMQGQTRVDFVMQFDCQGATQTIVQTTVADIVAMLASDRTLGGMINDIEESGTSGTEKSAPDVASTILEAPGFFFCPRGDLFTIVGAGGQLF